MAQKIKLNDLKKIVNQVMNEGMMGGSGGSGSDMKKFVMFAFNYPPFWIQDIWGRPDSKNSVEHMRDKFRKALGKYGEVGAMCGFYMDLDSENRSLLEEYIREHYR